MEVPTFICRPAAVALALVASCTSHGPPGPDAIHAYLRAEPYPRLVIEVDHVAGLEPIEPARDVVAEGLLELLDKPDGIEVVLDDALDPWGPDRQWTLDSLDAAMREHGSVAPPPGTVVMHALFVDGHWAEDTASEKVLGLSWGTDKVVVFRQTIAEVCVDPTLPPDKQAKLCELTVAGTWIHEIGHLLGLVDNGLPMVVDHLDPDPTHGAHDSNPDCIMHWSNSRGALVELLKGRIEDGNETLLPFGQACLDDIAAVRDAQ